MSAIKLTRARRRRETGLFLAEGPNSVAAAIESDRATEVFYTAAHADGDLVAATLAAGVPVAQVSARAARALSDAVTPPGIAAVCQIAEPALPEVFSARVLVVLVGVGDPGNAGTIIRIADATGAGAVVFAGDTVDPYNGKCVRSAAGSLFQVPVARMPGPAELLDSLSAAGYSVLATTVDGELALPDTGDLLRGKVAWLFGNEAHGLDPALAARATRRVRIPMRGRAESLNLAAAAAICLYATQEDG